MLAALSSTTAWGCLSTLNHTPITNPGAGLPTHLSPTPQPCFLPTPTHHTHTHHTHHTHPPSQGLDYLRKRINRGHERMELKEARVVAGAACPVDDTYFALVEYTYVSKLLDDKRPW